MVLDRDDFFAGMLIYQHAIVKPNDLSRVNIAFMTANGIASVVFAFFVIADMFITHKHLTGMARIMAIDYGLKRTGIAVTDPLQIIASALTTIESARIFTFLEEYLKKENVELILIGDPRNLDDSPDRYFGRCATDY